MIDFVRSAQIVFMVLFACLPLGLVLLFWAGERRIRQTLQERQARQQQKQATEQ